MLPTSKWQAWGSFSLLSVLLTFKLLPLLLLLLRLLAFDYRAADWQCLGIAMAALWLAQPPSWQPSLLCFLLARCCYARCLLGTGYTPARSTHTPSHCTLVSRIDNALSWHRAGYDRHGIYASTERIIDENKEKQIGRKLSCPPMEMWQMIQNNQGKMNDTTIYKQSNTKNGMKGQTNRSTTKARPRQPQQFVVRAS